MKNSIRKLLKLIYNSDENRLRAGYRILLTMLVFFILHKLSIKLVLLTGVKLYYSSEASLITFILGGLVRFVPIVLTLVIVSKTIDKRKICDFGFVLNREWWLNLLAGFLLGGFLMTIIFLISNSFEWISIKDTFYYSSVHQSFALPFIVFLVYCICTGAFEEMLARGYLLKNLAEGINLPIVNTRISILSSLLILSLIFGLSHLFNPDANFIGFLNLFLLGITFGIGYIYTGQLALPIGFHVGWNFFMGNVFGFPVSGIQYLANSVTVFRISSVSNDLFTGGEFGPEAGLLALFVNIIGITVIFAWVYLRNNRRIILHKSIADYSY